MPFDGYTINVNLWYNDGEIKPVEYGCLMTSFHLCERHGVPLQITVDPQLTASFENHNSLSSI